MDGSDAYSLIARVTKAQGLQGEVVVVPTDGLPFLLFEGQELWVVPPSLEGVRHTKVLAIRPLAKGWGIMLQGVKDVVAANELIGRQFLALSETLPEIIVEQDTSDLGIEIVDQLRGKLGQVIDELHTPAHPLWVVRGIFGELLIPVVDEFIVERNGKQIMVDLPLGLVPDAPLAEGETPCV